MWESQLLDNDTCNKLRNVSVGVVTGLVLACLLMTQLKSEELWPSKSHKLAELK
jgi:hypothetical protein